MEIFLENLFTTYSNFDYSVLFYLIAFLSVSVVAISKSGFGGGLGGLGVPIMLFILPAKIVLAVFLPLNCFNGSMGNLCLAKISNL